MRPGWIFALAILTLGHLRAQDCPAVARLQPGGTLSGTLGGNNCVLSDGTSYFPYRLDLPVRGSLQLSLGGPADVRIILRDESGTRLDSGVGIRRSLEAGSYRLLVNSKAPGSFGSYTVTAAFAAEPSMLCSHFPAIGRRQTISNTLGSYGCTAPDGTAMDGWSLTTFGSGTLTVTVASQDFSPTVVVRGSDGRALATSAGKILATPVQGDSQYTIVVYSADQGGGTYQLTTAFQNLADDSCRATRTFTDSDSDNGSIGADSCYLTIPGSGDQQYYNYYNFTMAAAGTAAFSVTSGDFAPTLYLLDESGNSLAVDSLGGGYDTSGNAHSFLRTFLPPGNYVLQVFSDVASGGPYQLQYTYQTDPPRSCTVNSAAPGDSRTSALSTASCRTAFGLSDLYRFTLDTAGTWQLDLSSDTFPGILAIRDTEDNLLVRSDEIDGVTAAHIIADLPAGNYTVSASAQSSSGAYRLDSKFNAHAVPACGFSQAIDLNGGYIQRLNSSGCKGANGQPVDYYNFTLAVDSLVLAVVTSSEVDGYLSLMDSTGSVLRTDDNSYGGIDPLIVQYLPAGSYKLAVRDASAATGGLYEVDLRTVASPRPAFCSAKSSLSLGAAIGGNITYTGCQYDEQTFADIYQLVLSADTTVDLRLSSPDFDAYLILLDAKGNVVADDDDGGGNTNSRVVVPLPTGTYYVIAKPFGDYLSHGAYALSADTAAAATFQK